MKSLILFYAFLLASSPLHAGYDPPVALDFRFQEELFTFKNAGNKPSGILNYYRTASERSDGSEATMIRGFLKMADCAKYAEERAASFKEKYPDDVVRVLHGGTADSAEFSSLRTDPKGLKSSYELWSFRKNPKQPFASITQLKVTETDPEAQKKLKEGFQEDLASRLSAMSGTEFPMVVLPARSLEAEEFAKVPEGVPVVVDQTYVEKVFAGDGPPPILQASFRISLPARFTDTTGVMGKMDPPEIFGFGQAGEKGTAIESISFTNLTHTESEDVVPQLPNLTMIVETVIVEPNIIANKGFVRERYWTRINGLDAAVILTETVRPNKKPFYHQYVLFPRPGATTGTLVTIRIDPEKSPDVKTVEDIFTFKGFANEVLASFSFAEAPPAPPVPPVPPTE